MIICHVSSMHEQDDDRIFQRACIGLKNLGHNVKFIVTHNKNEIIEGVEIIALKRRSRLKRRIFSSYEAFIKLLHLNCDIIHFHDPDLLPWMYVLSFKNKNIVYDVHENYVSRISKLKLPFIKPFLSKIYRKLENYISGKFAGVVVVTETMKKMFTIKKPVLVVDNLVYVERLKSINLNFRKTDYPLIYTSGTHSESRNVIPAIKAMPIILEQFPNAKMQFVGRYYTQVFKESLIELARRLHLENNISFDDMLPWAENFKRTSQAHIGCVFYQKNDNNEVTLPNRLYEYMYCGVAVLGEDFPEVRKVINESKCGMLLDSNNPAAIGDAVINMLKNPEKVIEMGQNGRNAVLSKLNFDSALQDLDKFYNKIVTAY